MGSGQFNSKKDEQKYIATVVATYWFVSISMVYLNKLLMSNETVSVPAPLFVTWFQCIITALICYGAGEIAARMKYQQHEYENLLSTANSSDDNKATDALEKKNSFWNQFPKVEYRVGPGKRVFPLSLVFVGMITFNNLCLKWVEVSFYNVARSLTIVFNVILSSMMLGHQNSNQVMYCLGIVIIGFFIGSTGELNFSLKGTVAGILSSLFVSLNSIYTKKILPAVDNDHWKLTFYNNVNASIMFIPLIIIFEHNQLYNAMSKQFFSGLFWLAMLTAGIFGFSIGIVTVLQIKATSPLTHNISGTAKAAVQSLLAFYIWKNSWTIKGLLGIFITLGGSLAYTYIKMNETSPPTTTTTSKKTVSSDQSSNNNKDDIELNKPLVNRTNSTGK